MSASDPAATRASVVTELERVARRWQQLSLDRALAASPGVRAVVQELADEVATADGLLIEPVPDLGPAVLLDQLRVMVFDYCRRAEEHPDALDPAALLVRLTILRRSIC